MRKRIFALLLLTAVSLRIFMFPSIVNAQQWWAPSFDEFNTRVNDPGIPNNEIYGERYTHAQVWWVIYSIMTWLIQPEVSECAARANSGAAGPVLGFLECLGIDTSDSMTTIYPSNPVSLGILDVTAMTDAMVINRPASGVQYVASKLQNFGLTGTAYAQVDQAGFGFNTLSPIENLWAVSRNAAYSLMTLAVVVLAFLVMFRARISPQASVTIQSAVPRIVIALLLITFSFAIAGFVIDLAYVILGLVSALIAQSNLTASDMPVLQVFNTINQIGVGLFSLALAVLMLVLLTVLALISLNLIPPVAVVATPAAIAVTVIGVILLLIFIIAAIRIFWLFLKTYVMVILLIIALPFAALGYVVSTGTNPFMQIMRSYVAQVAVFVVVVFMVMFAHILFWSLGALDVARNLQIVNPYRVEPPGGLDSSIGLPGFSGVNSSVLGVFLGVVVLLMAPGVATGIREWIKSGRYRQTEGMAGAGFAAGVGGFAGGMASGAVKGEVGAYVGNAAAAARGGSRMAKTVVGMTGGAGARGDRIRSSIVSKMNKP